MSDIEALAYHGWAFDAGCWQKLRELAGDNIFWKNFDRGYFQSAVDPSFSEDSTLKIVFTHSFGLHLCKKEVLRKADVLVIISGFLQFHPQAAQFRRRSRLVLDEMIKQLEQHPEEVLKTFYRNVYHPQKSFQLPPDEPDVPRLLSDLEKLNESCRDLPELKKTARICIFQGSDDAIVPKEKGRALYEQMVDAAQYFEIKEGGHALPMTHAAKCWEILQPIILNECSTL